VRLGTRDDGEQQRVVAAYDEESSSQLFLSFFFLVTNIFSMTTTDQHPNHCHEPLLLVGCLVVVHKVDMRTGQTTTRTMTMGRDWQHEDGEQTHGER
jgi:hypothetical protein